ncbi:MAG: two-component system NtrC family sensor kinase, partial [Candidatus Krumholzibacteriia bacterium]
MMNDSKRGSILMTDTKDLESQIAALPAGDSIERADLLTDLARQVAMGDIPRGMALNDESLAMSKRLSYDRGIRYATYHAGFGEYLKSEHEKAMATLLEAERMMQAGDDVAGLGLVQGIMGNVHLSLGDYERSLDSLFKGLKAHRAVGDDLHEAWLLHGIGGCYHEMGDHARALQYHSEALEQFEVLDLDVGRARALVGIGIVYQAQQDYDKALEHQKRSLAGFRKGENEFGESRALNDMGVTLQAQGDFVTARKHHERALELRKKFGNRQAVSTSLINLGKLLLAEGDVAAARDHVEQALVIAEEIAAKPRIFQSHLALSDIHAALGDPATALKHYKLYEQVKEKVAGDLANSRLINLQVGFEMEKADREAEISRLKNVELKEKNSQLEVLLNELHTTQAQLIQSEKMSALGSLVAGLLHEFNTPLGAITGISDVTDRCVSRIRSLVTERDSELLSNDKFAQALEIMESNQKVTQMATGRIGQITKSLQGFT